MRIFTIFIACVGLTWGLLFAVTPNTTSAHETGRYTLIETDEGVLRLDRERGTLTSCKAKNDAWDCKPVNAPDTETLDPNERQTIARLQQENKELRDQVKELESIQKIDPDKMFKHRGNRNLKLPSDEEIDEALSYMERLIRKFGGTIKRLKKENQEEGEEL